MIFFSASTQVYAEPKNTKGNNSERNTSIANELSQDEIDSLLFMREEEKMARDVYLTQYESWNDSVFDNIATSEQEHMDAIKPLLDTYNLPDPVIDEIGAFANSELEELYNKRKRQLNHTFKTNLKNGRLLLPINSGGINEPISK